jgi:predicted ATPase
LERLDLIDSYRLNPITGSEKDYEFLVRKYRDGPEVRLTDVGFGVSQVLPVLILCYHVPEGSILILEQPEAHLHPKVQSELADLLIEVVKNRQLQIILESHSEHLILRLMRRIAEEQISADDTAFYFCQMNEGTSEIERLNVDDYGNIANWPENFFGDATGDLVEKTRAEMKRKKEQGL